MAPSSFQYRIDPPVRLLRGLFYWIRSGKLNCDKQAFAAENISNWFVANLDPEYWHCFIGEHKFESTRIKCEQCDKNLMSSAKHGWISDLCENEREWSCPVGGEEQIVSPEVRALIIATKLTGMDFIPVHQYGHDISDDPDAFIVQPKTYLADGARYICMSGCGVCGNKDVQCAICNTCYRRCPECQTLRMDSIAQARSLDTVLLSSWNQADFVSFESNLLLTGKAMLGILENKCFGFAFGEVLVEMEGADDQQIAAAQQKSVPLERLLELVPGGAENNDAVFEEIA